MYKDALKKYLDDLAGKKPAPGGGSAAALAAALGVGLISMVCNFTIGKEKYRHSEDEIKKLLATSELLRERLLSLVDEDVISYQKLSDAYKLANETNEEKKRRDDAIQEGLREALTTPLKVCESCHEAMRLCPILVEKANTGLISDVGVCAALLESAFQSALMNVDINLNGIKDAEFIVQIREVLEPLEEEIGLIKDEVWHSVKERLVPTK